MISFDFNTFDNRFSSNHSSRSKTVDNDTKVDVTLKTSPTGLRVQHQIVWFGRDMMKAPNPTNPTTSNDNGNGNLARVVTEEGNLEPNVTIEIAELRDKMLKQLVDVTNRSSTKNAGAALLAGL